MDREEALRKWESLEVKLVQALSEHASDKAKSNLKILLMGGGRQHINNLYDSGFEFGENFSQPLE